MTHICGGFIRDAIEVPIEAALVVAKGRVTFGGTDVNAVAAATPGDFRFGPVVMLVGKADGGVERRYGGQLESMRAEARQVSAQSGQPVALAEAVKDGEDGDGDVVTILAARYLYEPHNRDTLIEAAHEAFPEALRLLSMGATQKKLDPLDPKFFDKLAASLSNYMARDFSKVSKPVFDKWINGIINANWAGATDAELALLTSRFNASFREIGGRHWVNIRGQVYHRTTGLGNAVKRATVKRYDIAISPNLALKDASAIQRMTAAHSHYVTDAMGNIATASSRQARMVVRNGLAKGLGSKEIGRDLFKALGDSLAGRTRAYFDMAAISMLNRAQTFSKAQTYSEAGVQKLIWDSVLDELTTRTCRFADGQVFSVRKVLGQFAKTDALKDPRDVRFTQPWMRERKIKSGEHKGLMGLFLRGKDGKDSMVAAELTSGMGKLNDRGTWHPAMDIETLEDRGFSAPPGHGNCRSTISPDMIPPRTRTRRVNVPAPRPKVPLLDPMGAKSAVAAVNAATAMSYFEELRAAAQEEAVAHGKMPPTTSKYDKVIGFSEKHKIPPVFSSTSNLALEDAKSDALDRIKGILLATMPKAISELREVRLDKTITADAALAKVDYNEKTRVLKISKAAAKDKSEAGKYATGKQLAYALELERRRATHKDKKITAKDREAARKADLENSTGKLFDAEALETVK
jgi:hypothetical protein